MNELELHVLSWTHLTKIMFGEKKKQVFKKMHTIGCHLYKAMQNNNTFLLSHNIRTNSVKYPWD